MLFLKKQHLCLQQESKSGDVSLLIFLPQNILLPDSANISPLANYGVGNVFLWNTLVRANASIGNFNLLNAAAIVHHDVVMGFNNVLLPQAQILGDSSMEDNNLLASSAVVVPQVKMGNENTISAGEVLFDNLENRKFFQSGFVVNKP